MILGGSKYIVPVIKKAHELGIFVITCDFLPNNYAHKYADKYINVSIIEKDKVLEAARKEKVNGIISFACDPGVVTACYVAEKLNLPNVGPLESVEILQNKALFRSFLKENDFNVPFFKNYSNFNDIKKDLGSLVFPLIVKPTDSAGSKGVSKVNNSEELLNAARDAFEVSIKKEIIVEQFIEFKGHPSDADSLIIDGKFVYFGLNSQLFDKGAANPYTPTAYYWPTVISDKNRVYIKNELERLFKLLKLRACILNIEVREDINGVPYIMEVSPRGGGNRLTEMINYGTGIDLITEYLKYSVGMKSCCCNKIKQVEFCNWCEVILHAKKGGVFKGVNIADSCLKFLYEKDIWIGKNTLVKDFTGANQTIGTLIFKFDSLLEMIKFTNDIDSFVKVEVE